MTIFAGQTDTADASHFTIPYMIDGKPGMIDGWLRDDGLVLKARAGQFWAHGETRHWDLAPTSAPSTQP